jgi:hypothetical protein
MSIDSSKELGELEPGPVEIRVREGSGVPETVGYALIEVDASDTYKWYFVIEENVQFPLQNQVGVENQFIGIDAPDDSPEVFLEWVLVNGEIGTDVKLPYAEETYSTWEA